MKWVWNYGGWFNFPGRFGSGFHVGPTGAFVSSISAEAQPTIDLRRRRLYQRGGRR
jgi:hypothetical protein